MGHIITIEPQIRARQTVTILNPVKDLREILDNDMGMEVANLFDEAINDAIYNAEIDEIKCKGDDYEKIADGYHNMLSEFVDELEEILSQKRLNRGRLERLHERINREL